MSGIHLTFRNGRPHSERDQEQKNRHWDWEKRSCFIFGLDFNCFPNIFSFIHSLILLQDWESQLLFPVRPGLELLERLSSPIPRSSPLTTNKTAETATAPTPLIGCLLPAWHYTNSSIELDSTEHLQSAAKRSVRQSVENDGPYSHTITLWERFETQQTSMVTVYGYEIMTFCFFCLNWNLKENWLKNIYLER